VRHRPILGTAVTLFFGVVPLALGRGPGSGSRGSIARVIIGGQALSLLITLLITPVAYSLFDDAGRWLPNAIARLRAVRRTRHEPDVDAEPEPVPQRAASAE